MGDANGLGRVFATVPRQPFDGPPKDACRRTAAFRQQTSSPFCDRTRLGECLDLLHRIGKLEIVREERLELSVRQLVREQVLAFAPRKAQDVKIRK